MNNETLVRPYPPHEFLEAFSPYIKIIPAPEINAWVQQHLLDDNGDIHNSDHTHLIDADICFMWASLSFNKKGRYVLGQCEEVMMRAGGWQKARMEQQMYEWFGRIPKFVITLAADYCAQCSDAEFCALVEHELYHIAQDIDEFGTPKFTQEGMPKLRLRGHDVEEFIGVVRRYGASEKVQAIIDAASEKPEVARLNISRACGTCLMKLA
ncbi:putative metallopeptidase [Providencia manganoxydans]|uniref:putative metallopeptidase n=1 Tax=Providencia manganoxydans TaxID=2923283 RepID=UPI0029C0ED4E|nr:putative metallopeptidase [Providencia manganoxydans]MDX4947166.1 putative metallopeptidase [Providencia manganoxydans]